MGVRDRTSGFVMLDALIAFAIAALALTLVLAILPAASKRHSERIFLQQAVEFAYSVMEEYRTTFPVMPTHGEEPSGWSWTINEGPLEVAGTVRLMGITVTTWHRDRPELRATMRSSMALRLE